MNTNDATRANDTALPEFSPAIDPIIKAIDDYQSGLAAFNRLPESKTDEEEDAQVAVTYGPPLDVLDGWSKPALTREGALAALKMVEAERGSLSLSTKNMLTAALAYLEQSHSDGGPNVVRLATPEDYAALEFEAWSPLQPGDWTPPTGEAARTILSAVDMVLRYSHKTLFKTKDEIKAQIATWDEEQGDLLRIAFEDTRNFLKIATVVIDVAEIRILSAGAALEMEEQATEGQANG